MGRHDNTIDLDDQRAGSQLRRIRQKNGVSLTEMTSRLNVSKSFLSGIENSLSAPTKRILQGYADAFDFSLLDLETGFKLVEDPFVKKQQWDKKSILRDVQKDLHALKEMGYYGQLHSPEQREKAQELKTFLHFFGLALVWDDWRKEYVIADGEE